MKLIWSTFLLLPSRKAWSKMTKYIEMKYLGTYYYANILHNVLKNSFEYLTNFEAVFGNQGILYFAKPFRKKSNLHIFIEFIIESIFFEEKNQLTLNNCLDRSNFDFANPTYITPLEKVFQAYSIEHLSFQDWRVHNQEGDLKDEHIEYYYEDLSESDGFYNVVEKLTEDVFYILFLNRELLQRFNELLSSYLENCVDDDQASEIINKERMDKIVRSDFKLYRKNIPMWVKRAVFFRDRGICVHCGKDLSGYLSIFNTENYDHIVPLNLHGFNDVSNIQLLCSECNSDKLGNRTEPTIKYQRWYKL